MRISDWSSDVCSSDLPGHRRVPSRRGRKRDYHCRRQKTGSGGRQSQCRHPGKCACSKGFPGSCPRACRTRCRRAATEHRHWCRSEEHTSELQSLMRISYAVFCLKKKTKTKKKKIII